MDDPQGQGLLHHLHVAGRGHGDDVDRHLPGAQIPHQHEAVAVRQIHIEQDQIDLVRVNAHDAVRERRQRVLRVARDPHDTEAVHPRDVGGMRLRGDLLVLDDEHAQGTVRAVRLRICGSHHHALTVDPRHPMRQCRRPVPHSCWRVPWRAPRR